ncbi:hypothetical protein BS47DRAFT_1396930 [Hydnum rufescens UP504]|uniref:Protein kinase domain-containing protein n=1 Tax=Hydnum rufescens UP504 TaxID=1448309 RepID=A0A9P6AP23_9AGAM|nr:hypothetical protein BS47DRAFT_1396930 [Hydnum rufescens UP504]
MVYSSSVFGVCTLETTTPPRERSLFHSSSRPASTRLSDVPPLPEEDMTPPGIEALHLNDLTFLFQDSSSNPSSFNSECPREDPSPEAQIFAASRGGGSSQHSRLTIHRQAPPICDLSVPISLFSNSMDGTDARSCRSFGLKGGNNPHSFSLRENMNSPSDSVVPDLTGEIYNMTSITRGGYSSVFRADWKMSKVFVRIIRREHGDKTIKRLTREARVWRSLNHRNVVPLLGVVPGKLGPGLVSPWYSNGNILQYIQQVPNCEDVANGLRYLHEQDPPIVHGDLKGANVLVDINGRAALCDFGLSTILDSGPTGFTSFVLGSTLRFKAPEEFADDLDGGSIPRDVYSYACVYGQIMTGDPRSTGIGPTL